MKKFIFFITVILAAVICLGGGCVSVKIEDRGESVNSTNGEPSVFSGEGSGESEVSPEDLDSPTEDPTFEWEVYRSEPWAIEIRYPARYKTVHDTYGWPHSLVHFIETEGRQSYRARIETWDREDGFRSLYGEDPAFIQEHPNQKNWVTIHYNPDDPAYPGLADEWRLIISTFRFTPTP